MTAVAIAKLADGPEFEAGEGTTLLDAALAAGIVLPYSCRTGRCSTCKAKVRSGTTRALIAESGLAPGEAEEGWILTCARAAVSDVVLEAEDLAGVTLHAPRTLPCRIAQLAHLAPDVIRVVLRVPPAADFAFIAGQYVDLIGPGGTRRSYSLANASFADKTLELHIRAVDGGAMSRYWFGQAKVNDLLRLHGPLGTFFLRDVARRDLIFLATGTGIAPVKAMLESMAQLPVGQRPASTMVLWGGRKPHDLYLDVAAIPGDHAYIPVLSRPEEDWSGARGYVQDVLSALNPPLGEATVYACGSDTMIHGAKDLLAKCGLGPGRFYSDAFVSSGVN